MPRFVTLVLSLADALKPSILRYQSELSKTVVNNFSLIKKQKVKLRG